MARKGGYGTGNVPVYPGQGWFPRTAPRKAEGGVALASGRGEIARTWWSRRWIEVLESFGWASRLARGRDYARRGQVLELRVSAEGATARVQGTRARPYDVSIRLRPVKAAAWGKVESALREDAGLVARLLAGEVPQEMERVFRDAGASLLPRSASDIRTDCSCPDTANPCKHIAAVHYLLAERFDQDPFLIFLLRGKRREDVLDTVASRPAERPEPEARDVTVRREPAGDLLAYWRPGPRLAAAECTPHAPDIAHAILRRTGPPAFCSGAQAKALQQALGRAYDAVTARAIAAARGERGAPALPAMEGVRSPSSRRRGQPFTRPIGAGSGPSARGGGGPRRHNGSRLGGTTTPLQAASPLDARGGSPAPPLPDARTTPRVAGTTDSARQKKPPRLGTK